MPHLDVRVRLGEKLRHYRKAARLSGEQVAAAVGCTQAKISRVEAGKTRIAPDDVRRWLDATGAPADVYDELIELAQRAEVEIAAWRELHASGWAKHQRDYDELEREAKSISIWQPSLVPGLLQTAAYTSHLLREVLGLPAKEVGAGVSARLERQEVVYRPNTRLRVVVAEHVLRHRFGGAAVMAEQLHRIATLARLPTVDFGVVPTNTHMLATYGTSMVIYESPDEDESLVIVELPTSVVRERKPENVALYTQRFTTYQDAAIRGDQAAQFVERIANEMTDEAFRAG